MHISLRGSWSAGPTPAGALLLYRSHAPTRPFQSRIMAEAAAGGRLSNRANIYWRISGAQRGRLQLWSNQSAGLTVGSVSIVLNYKIMWLNISAWRVRFTSRAHWCSLMKWKAETTEGLQVKSNECSDKRHFFRKITDLATSPVLPCSCDWTELDVGKVTPDLCSSIVFKCSNTLLTLMIFTFWEPWLICAYIRNWFVRSWCNIGDNDQTIII